MAVDVTSADLLDLFACFLLHSGTWFRVPETARYDSDHRFNVFFMASLSPNPFIHKHLFVCVYLDD